MKMKISTFLMAAVLISGCATEIGDRYNRRNEKAHSMWFSRSFSEVPGEVNIQAHVRVPHKYLVFVKTDSLFVADIEVSVTVLDRGTEQQILKKTWQEDIQLDNYQDTRRKNMSYITQAQFTLPPGEYMTTAIVIDNDSKHKWQLKQDLLIEPVQFWSDIIPYIRVGSELADVGNNISQADTVFCRFHTLERDIRDDLIVHYSVIQDDSVLTMDSVPASFVEKTGAYQIIIPLQDNLSGYVDVHFATENVEQTITLTLNRDTLDDYLDNLEDTVIWMSVILPHSDYQQLKEMKPAAQREFLVKYWKTLDPSPETEYNELLDQFYRRIEFTNENFGVLTKGWRSDMGRTYIKYGPPNTVENTGTDSFGRSYQIWTYASNKQFVFVNDGFGDYRLVRETN